MTELYKLHAPFAIAFLAFVGHGRPQIVRRTPGMHAPFAIAFLAFVVLFVVSHVRR